MLACEWAWETDSSNGGSCPPGAPLTCDIASHPVFNDPSLLPLLSPLVGSLGRGVSPKACKVARCMQEEADRGRERKKKDGEADDGFKHHTHSLTHKSNR